jgi:hypothetical protein
MRRVTLENRKRYESVYHRLLCRLLVYSITQPCRFAVGQQFVRVWRSRLCERVSRCFALEHVHWRASGLPWAYDRPLVTRLLDEFRQVQNRGPQAPVAAPFLFFELFIRKRYKQWSKSRIKLVTLHVEINPGRKPSQPCRFAVGQQFEREWRSRLCERE